MFANIELYLSQGCTKFLNPLSNVDVQLCSRVSASLLAVRGEGKFIKSVGEEVVKRGRKYHDCGEEYNVEKREAIIIFPIILRRISSGEEDGMFGEENED